MRVGERLRDLRRARNLTQGALGRRLNVTDATVSRWETGALGIDADMVPELARVLGVRPADLFDAPQWDLGRPIDPARRTPLIDVPIPAIRDAAIRAFKEAYDEDSGGVDDPAVPEGTPPPDDETLARMAELVDELHSTLRRYRGRRRDEVNHSG
jgi:transcriptional regulator with XRE-family HTH domain